MAKKKKPVKGPAPHLGASGPMQPKGSAKAWSDEIMKMFGGSAMVAAAAASASMLSPSPRAAKPLYMPPAYGVGGEHPATAALQEELQGWLDGLYNAVATADGYSRFRFRPIIIVRGTAENDIAHGATRYRFDARVDLMTHEGKCLKAPKEDDRCISYMVRDEAPFPFGEIVGQFKTDLVKQLPKWKERYDNRHTVAMEDVGILSPMIMPLPATLMPGGISHGAASYAKSYADRIMEETAALGIARIKHEAGMREQSEQSKKHAEHLYGYAPIHSEYGDPLHDFATKEKKK